MDVYDPTKHKEKCKVSNKIWAFGDFFYPLPCKKKLKFKQTVVFLLFKEFLNFAR